MDKEEVMDILIEEIDEEILARMPEWFKILRDELKRKTR